LKDCWNKRNDYLDFTNKQVVQLPISNEDISILHVDLKKKRLVGVSLDEDQHTIGLYDFKGN
jgi:hypothetical protein